MVKFGLKSAENVIEAITSLDKSENDFAEEKGENTMKLNDLTFEDKPMRLVKAAEYLGICQKTLKRAAERGRLKIFKIGGRWFILPSEILAYLKRQQKRSCL